MLRRASVLLLLPALAACRTRPVRGEEGPPKAVVLFAPERIEDARAHALALNEHGYDVVTKSTPVPRERSSMAIYGVHGRPERVTEIPAILAGAGIEPPEVLPFQQRATGGNAVVIWLARKSE